MNQYEKIKAKSDKIAIILFIAIIALTVVYFVILYRYQEILSIKADIITTQALTIDLLKVQVSDIETKVANICLTDLIFG